MTYHWHDDEFDWCPCDEDEEGFPIRVPAQKVPRPRKKVKHEDEPEDKAS
jgi:hypothetical protein